MVKSIAALLIVFSAARAVASFDSASHAAYCKVMSVENEKQFRIIYQSPATQNVEIQLFDSKQHKIYSEKLDKVSGFVKNYDLAELPIGMYTFKVVSASGTYTEQVTLVERDFSGLHFSQGKDGKVALVGKNDTNVELSLYIVDETGNSIYQEKLPAHQDVTKLYDMKKVSGKQVSFVIYDHDRIVKTADVKL